MSRAPPRPQRSASWDEALRLSSPADPENAPIWLQPRERGPCSPVPDRDWWATRRLCGVRRLQDLICGITGSSCCRARLQVRRARSVELQAPLLTRF